MKQPTPLYLRCKRQRVGVRNNCEGCMLSADPDYQCIAQPRPPCLVIDRFGNKHSFIFVLKQGITK